MTTFTIRCVDGPLRGKVVEMTTIDLSYVEMAMPDETSNDVACIRHTYVRMNILPDLTGGVLRWQRSEPLILRTIQKDETP